MRRVGLFELEFTQPMDYMPLTVGTRVAISTVSHAKRLKMRKLTQWIADIFWRVNRHFGSVESVPT